MNENDSKYLIFNIGEDQYGSPLLSIREVLEYQKPKFMPNMVASFSGVINVRGAIVGVVDLRSRFSINNVVGPKTAMLLCDTEKGSIVAVVDLVESVIEFEPENIEAKPPIKSRVEQKYLIGVAKRKEQLITILDLHKLLNEEEYKAA
jgi:purine-binding chemotaxis protein CheW